MKMPPAICGWFFVARFAYNERVTRFIRYREAKTCSDLHPP